MTFQRTTENTVKKQPAASCGHCCGHGHGHDAVSAWMKPEIVFLCALGTFGISAVIWAITTPHEKPVQAAKAPVTVAAPVAAQPAVSEMERLFAQAGNMPPAAVATPKHVVVKKKIEVKPVVAVKPVEWKAVEVKRVEEKPVEVKAAEIKPAEVKTTEAKTPQPKAKKVEIAAKPAAEPENKSVDDVAEYNRALAGFFENKKSAASDTADGAGQPTLTVEPPSYEEWLKSGKPSF